MKIMIQTLKFQNCCSIVLLYCLLLLTACNEDDGSPEPDQDTDEITDNDPTDEDDPIGEDDPVDDFTPLVGLLFETNFKNDEDYSVSNIGLWNGGGGKITQPPSGWDGVLVSGNGSIEVLSGEGKNKSNALKLNWDPDLGQPVAQLAKHLTNDASAGYDEIFVRYHVRLPNKFKAGENASFIPYWKWGRLYQNTTIEKNSNGLTSGNWTENRVDSRYVVWNFGGGVPYTDVNVVWGENFGDNLHKGSAGGERQSLDFFVSGSDQHNAPGYFESLWDINVSDRPGELENNTSQTWHTLEFRFKLATTETSNDGEFQMWWNGVGQGSFSRIRAGGGAPTRTGIPTAKGDGSGFNFFVFFDNMAGWNKHWGKDEVEGGIYVNDVVISTERIGHEYVAGNTDNTIRQL